MDVWPRLRGAWCCSGVWGDASRDPDAGPACTLQAPHGQAGLSVVWCRFYITPRRFFARYLYL